MKYVKRHAVRATRRAQIGKRIRLCHLEDKSTVDMARVSIKLKKWHDNGSVAFVPVV
jgi:hypothetical protein